MCVRTIIDANTIHGLTDRKKKNNDNVDKENKDNKDNLYPSFQKLRDWFENRDGLLMWTDEEKFASEMGAMMNWRLLREYRESNRMEIIEASRVDAEKRYFRGIELQSGTKDIHLLALARAAKVEVLCTDDNPLKSDFKNKKVLPRLSGRDRAVYPLPRPEDRDKEPSDKMLRAESRFLAERKCPRRC